MKSNQKLVLLFWMMMMTRESIEVKIWRATPFTNWQFPRFQDCGISHGAALPARKFEHSSSYKIFPGIVSDSFGAPLFLKLLLAMSIFTFWTEAADERGVKDWDFAILFEGLDFWCLRHHHHHPKDWDLKQLATPSLIAGQLTPTSHVTLKLIGPTNDLTLCLKYMFYILV